MDVPSRSDSSRTFWADCRFRRVPAAISSMPDTTEFEILVISPMDSLISTASLRISWAPSRTRPPESASDDAEMRISLPPPVSSVTAAAISASPDATFSMPLSMSLKALRLSRLIFAALTI